MQERAGPRTRLPLGRVIVVVMMTVMLSSCICDEFTEVDDVAVSDGHLVAVVVSGSDGRHVFDSTDGGRTWSDAGLPPPLSVDLARPSCGSDGTCFRTAGSHIEVSKDDSTWTTVWSIPVGRTQFVREMAGEPLSCPDTGTTMNFTTEMVAFDGPAGTIGVVGMGNQGVVVIDGDSVHRVGVGALTPTPFTTVFGPGSAEMQTVLLFALLVFAGLARFAVVAYRRRTEYDVHGAPRFIVVLLFLVLVFMLVILLTPFGWGGLGRAWPAAAVIAAVALALAGPALRHRVPGAALRILAAVGGISAAWFVAVALPLQVMAIGWLPSYRAATLLSLVAGMTGVAWCARLVEMAVDRIADAHAAAAEHATAGP